MSDLVSVITPTWQRADLLIDRCIPSVQAQTYPNVEHVIVCDGPDDALALRLGETIARRGWHGIVYKELWEHDPAPHWGHLARLAGIEAARGELICYCDDDDSLRPDHVARLAGALAKHPEAGFAVSRMVSHGPSLSMAVGWAPLAPGTVGSPMIVHRRETLQHGTWGPASFTEDWDLVQRWLAAGITYANVNAETADVWPSRFR